MKYLNESQVFGSGDKYTEVIFSKFPTVQSFLNAVKRYKYTASDFQNHLEMYEELEYVDDLQSYKLMFTEYKLIHFIQEFILKLVKNSKEEDYYYNKSSLNKVLEDLFYNNYDFNNRLNIESQVVNKIGKIDIDESIIDMW